ncbi:MAG TPA: riboflavin synthase [Chthoniobacterales bacterium]
MFTGLVEATTAVIGIAPRAEGAALRLRPAPALGQLAPGDSLAVNGCCLTVTRQTAGELKFDVLLETLRRTNLGALEPGSVVNLERSLRADSRLGGHFVQGHVDTTAALRERREANGDLYLRIELPPESAGYVAFKGSISLNGVSLTVAEVLPDSFAVWIIPHTRQHTNLDALRPGGRINVEFDILAKYVERLTSVRAA